MGKYLSTLRTATSALFGTPNPTTVRKYGVLLFIILAIPKYGWDLFRLRKLLTISKTAFDDKDKAKDPVKTVLYNKCTKGVASLKKAWELVLIPYCSHATDIREQIETYFDTVDQQLLLLKPNTELKDQDTPDSLSPIASNEELSFFEEEVPDDTLLSTWQSTLNKTCKNPLTVGLDLEIEDETNEQEIREITRALSYLSGFFEDLIALVRKEVALKLFQDSLQLQECNTNENDLALLQLTYPGDLAVQAILILTDKKERQDAISDLVSRKRTKLLTRAKEQYWNYYRISPEILKAALETKKISPEVAKLPYDYSDLWIGLRDARGNAFYGKEKKRVARDRQNEKVVPKHNEHAFLITLNLELAIKCVMTTTTIDLKMGGIRKQRFWKLIRFCWNELVGTWQQRSLMIVGWFLTAVQQSMLQTESYFRYNLLIQSVIVAVNAARGGLKASLKASLKGGLKGGGSRSSSTLGTNFFDVCLSIVILKAFNTILNDVKEELEDIGTGSIRKDLANRLTHHVLSQDLDDMTSNDGTVNASEALKILETVKTDHAFKKSIGAVLQIPSSIISQISSIGTSVVLLWNQSARLTFIIMCTILIVRRVEQTFQRFQWYCIQKCGFDKNTFEGYYEAQDIADSINSFADMRVAAKEHIILKKSDLLMEKKKMEMLRARLIPDTFRPFSIFLSDVPMMIGSYVGALLAMQNNGISPANLGGFTSTARSLLNQFDNLYENLKNLLSLKDGRFIVGLQIVELFEQKPKCGIDGGWQPVKENEDENENEDANENEKNKKKKNVVSLSLDTLPPKENSLTGDIEFKNVSFKYKGKQKNMLKKVSYKIKEGSFVGICGESGAGKSTMFKLLLRLHEVGTGSIEINGHPLNYYNPVFLRSQIGLAKQKPTIFHYKSIRDNVLFGSEHRIMEMGGPLAADQFVKAALIKASIWTTFENKEKFPQGIDTICNDLSGGEVQRVGIARALLSVSPILLCDELTAGLDAIHEENVVKNVITDRPKGQTVIAVAHKLSTIKDADQIICVSVDGSIEVGTFEELSHSSVRFGKMRRAQELGFKMEDKNEHDEQDEQDESNDYEESDVQVQKEQRKPMSPMRFRDVVKQVIQKQRTSRQNINDDSVQSFAKNLATLRKQIDSIDGLPIRIYHLLERACDDAIRYQKVANAAASSSTWESYAAMDAEEKEPDARSVELMHKEAIKMGKLLRQQSTNRRVEKRKLKGVSDSSTGSSSKKKVFGKVSLRSTTTY